MPELVLDANEREAFMSHLDSVSVPELMRRESSANTRARSGVVQLFAGGGCLPVPPGSRPMDHSQHGADRKPTTDLEPRLRLLPRPAVHSDFTALAAFPASDKHGTAGLVEITPPGVRALRATQRPPG